MGYERVGPCSGVPAGRAGAERRQAQPGTTRSLPAQAVGTRAHYVASRCCTTQRLNAHRTAVRMLLYPWHPWSGLSVHVHEATERGNATAFRCSLSGDVGRCREVPAWMLEQEACVPLVMAGQPRV
jgi:hypothetical protein